MIRHPRQQRTIARPAEISGFGYWSGRDVTVELRPAEVDTGVVFVRHDLKPLRRISVTIANLAKTPRRTTLTENGASVEMVEHLLAALAGLQIDNCEVWIDGTELPAGDGSSLQVVEALTEAGVTFQDALRHEITLSEAVRVGDERSWIEARPCTKPMTTVRYDLDYGTGNPIGRQQLEIGISPQTFCNHLAPARTFLLKQEADLMKASGVGPQVTYRDLLVFDDCGPIDNQLRFSDECVRHKILDVVGDLSLAGCDIYADIRAYRSGHRLNAELVQQIVADHAVQLCEMKRSA